MFIIFVCYYHRTNNYYKVLFIIHHNVELGIEVVKNLKMKNDKKEIISLPDDEFHIGITMAGAVSAGCYTAGVMDYLFEILDLWEKGKNNELPEDFKGVNLDLIPKHKVIIDAMGGTSAGGMTTMMAAIYALRGKINPVNNPNSNPTEKKDNVMYDSWVLMGEEEGGAPLLSKLFNTSDLDKTKKVQSLLNSQFIDEICENAFYDDGKPKNKFPYISDQLEIILAHTMLRSVPLEVDFNTPSSKLRKKKENVTHSSFDHFTVSHYKLDYDENLHENKYLPLKPFDPVDSKVMKLATMATGAFPIGLKFREFFNNELSRLYIKNTTEKIIFNRFGDELYQNEPDLQLNNVPDPFPFVSVDGGAINNEPFGEVLDVLKKRYPKKEINEPHKYGLVMIDPFPDKPDKEVYKQPEDVFSVVPAIIGTLWDQSKVKRGEMLDSYSSDYLMGQIFPVKRKGNIKEDHPIACGAAMAFSGMLDIKFRHHDFFLGRDNARNFFSTYFTLPCKMETEIVKGKVEFKKPYKIIEAHPIHKNWTSEMIDIFEIRSEKKDEGILLLPIIPDLYKLKEELNDINRNPFAHSVQEMPKFNPQGLFALESKMQQRFKKILELSFEKMKNGKPEKESKLTEKWLNKYYENNWWTRLKSWIGSGILIMLFKLNKDKLANRMTQSAIKWVLKELEKKNLLKESE